MKTILTGNDAIEAYENTWKSASKKMNLPRVCGYFTSDDCELTSKQFDKGSIVAFDSTDGNDYEESFEFESDAINWINQ